MIYRAIAFALAVGTAAIGIAPVAGMGNHAPVTLAGALGKLQWQDARLQSVGWRLATGNAPYCPRRGLAIGLLVQDMMNYSDPAGARDAAGIAGDIAVAAVAEGSHAARAGLRANDELLGIGEEDPMARPSPGPGDYTRLAALHDLIDRQLERDGHVVFRLARPGGGEWTVQVDGQMACLSRFTVVTGNGRAAADGERILIGQDFADARGAGAALPDDEFAAAVAHEFAHNLLEHQREETAAPRDWREIRKSEREADRLSIWLLANAGYDAQAAERLMTRRAGEAHPASLRAPTHDSWPERARIMAEELTRLRAALAGTHEANWRRAFLREP